MMHSLTILFAQVWLKAGLPLHDASGTPAGVFVVSNAAAFTALFAGFLLVVALIVLWRGNRRLVRDNRKLRQDLEAHREEIQKTNSKIMEQERLNAMGQIASGIIHDINNALVPISLYTEVLLQESPALTPEAEDYLNTILEATHDIENITTRVRAFYQKPGKGDARRPVVWDAVFKQVVAMSRPRWKNMVNRRGAVIDISSNVQPDLPPFWGNESEIREALLNIILNSVDAMPRGGRIVLSAHSSGSRIVVQVQDTGQGMSDEQRRRCLEPFYTTKGAKGTGLGLAAVYGMMQRHGGNIEVESEIGSGTTIRLVFPITEPEGEQPDPDEPEYKVDAVRVLYVDDDDVVLNALTHILTAQGFSVTPVESAEMALSIFESSARGAHPFDVIITDLSMPHMNGREIARRIKKLSPATPVILLSGWGEVADETEEPGSCVDRVFGKPPNIAELSKTIGALAAREA